MKVRKLDGIVTVFGGRWRNSPAQFLRLTHAVPLAALAMHIYVSLSEKKISAYSSPQKKVADTVGVASSKARVATPRITVRQEPPERKIRVKEWLDRSWRRFPGRGNAPSRQPASRTDSPRFTELNDGSNAGSEPAIRIRPSTRPRSWQGNAKARWFIL